MVQVNPLWLLELNQKINLILVNQVRLWNKMGVVEDAVARFVSRDAQLVTALKDAQAKIKQLVETDASEDAAQRDALLNDIAGSINSTVDGLEAVPTDTPVEGGSEVSEGSQTPADDAVQGTPDEGQPLPVNPINENNPAGSNPVVVVENPDTPKDEPNDGEGLEVRE